jgi:hypothetical protein
MAELYCASSRLVALGTRCARGMEEQERVASQVLERDCDDVPSAGEARGRVAHSTFGLKPSCPEPLVREGEADAAVVVLAVVDPHRASALHHGAVPRHAVRHPSQELRRVGRGVGIMTYPEKGAPARPDRAPDRPDFQGCGAEEEAGRT